MKVIHLSFNNDIEMPMIPRQPYGSELAVAGSDFEEKLPDRISFSPTVMKSFLAIYPNISQYFEDKEYGFPYMDMYAYGVDLSTKDYGVISERDMLGNVLDHHITDEVAITVPVFAKLIGKIRFYNPTNNMNIKKLRIHPFNNHERKPFTVPIVDYDVIEQYDDTYRLWGQANETKA